MSKKFIVIGASAVSVSFMSKLRSFDQTSQIICFSGESTLPYNRCLLADVVQLEKREKDILLKSPDFFAKNEIDLRLNSWVTAIDKDAKTVIVGDMQESYDYLFVGIGTSPYIPSIAGTDLPGVFGFHALGSIDRLDLFIQDMMPKTAVVIGAGINGVEAASALVARGLRVTLVDMTDAIMSQQLDKNTARFVEKLAQDAGVTIIKGQQVTALKQTARASVGCIEFASGAFLPTHCVVFATGSRVNGALLEKAGLVMDQGSVLVDEAMRTSDTAIYAGGDICMAQDIVSKELVKSATWADAMLQGLTAATQFSDAPRAYPGIVGMRDSEFFGVEFYACGQTADTDVFEVVEVSGKDFLHKFYMFDGLLKGFVLIGNVENLACYRTLYLNQQPVEKTCFVIEN